MIKANKTAREYEPKTFSVTVVRQVIAIGASDRAPLQNCGLVFPVPSTPVRLEAT